jgi:hypothetical protein
MNISANTISALEKIISGNPIASDKGLTPYRSGPDLISFFKQFGSADVYGDGFPSRWKYVEDKLHEYNNSSKMKKIVERAVDPRVFIGTEYESQEALDYINSFLKYDGYEVRKIGDFYKVREIAGNLVDVDSPFSEAGMPNEEYVLEQLTKSKQKIADGDYDGAITNARTLVEAVLLEMEYLLTGKRKKFDGKINKLYRKVYNLLNLNPAREDISNSLREILSGLISIVSGIGSLRNRMSDAHARSYKPEKHHAELAINSARTVVSFLFSTFEYQLKLGHISMIALGNESTETENAT